PSSSWSRTSSARPSQPSVHHGQVDPEAAGFVALGQAQAQREAALPLLTGLARLAVDRLADDVADAAAVVVAVALLRYRGLRDDHDGAAVEGEGAELGHLGIEGRLPPLDHLHHHVDAQASVRVHAED